MARRRVYLTYLGDVMKEPVIYEMGHKYKVVTNIRGATIKDDIGLVTLEVTGDDAELDRALAWIESKGVKVEPIEMEDTV
jgi:ABC-type methionine transport system ATPase subunit